MTGSAYENHRSKGKHMTERYTNIGKRVPKMDAEEKARGKAIYVNDIRLPGMLHGKILWSKHPHARIVSIDTIRAEAGLDTKTTHEI